MRFFLAILISLFSALPVYAAQQPDISAQAACVINGATKQVLYEKNADKLMYPASTTKIMTTLVALKSGDLESIVTVDGDAARCEGSSLYLSEGDKLTLKELLYGMMLVSGNDAAEAVAQHVAGSREAFVKMMNEEAKRIGAKNTHFMNPHGLPDGEHYTTARDLAFITAEAYSDPLFADIVSTARRTIQLTRGASREAVNTNRLLKIYPDANGVKTGYTNAAGCCLVAGAGRDGVEVVAVLLNDDDRWEDAANLLDYGFQVITEKPPQKNKKAAI